MPILLVVEDSSEDYFMLRRGLSLAGFASEMLRCETGEQALDYLRQCGQSNKQDAAAQPDLNLQFRGQYIYPLIYE